MKIQKPWNDVLVPNLKEDEMDILPKWFRDCVSNNHETEFVDNEIGCATCNRFETLKRKEGN